MNETIFIVLAASGTIICSIILIIKELRQPTSKFIKIMFNLFVRFIKRLLNRIRLLRQVPANFINNRVNLSNYIDKDEFESVRAPVLGYDPRLHKSTELFVRPVFDGKHWLLAIKTVPPDLYDEMMIGISDKGDICGKVESGNPALMFRLNIPRLVKWNDPDQPSHFTVPNVLGKSLNIPPECGDKEDNHCWFCKYN